MLEWCTKIVSSSPVGALSEVGIMKPNPFLFENHFTFPVILDMVISLGTTNASSFLYLAVTNTIVSGE